MKLTKITTGLSKMTGRTGLVLKKYSPEILLVVGITGTVASAVMACRATLQVEEVLDRHRTKIDKIGECWEKVEDGEISLDEYSEKDHKKDLTVAYVQTAVDFVKLYGPAVTLGVASIACVVGGHGIMKKRNVALVAAYKAVEEGFNSYRQRVRDEYGEETDYMFKNGLRAETVTETEVGEDGKSKKVKKTKLNSDDTNGLSVYARFFDESCSQWTKTPEYNFMFLRAQQNYFNDMLKVRGHVFLNGVYDALGIPRSSAGAMVGWVMRKDGEGDNFIDFGIFDGDRQKTRDFVNGYERSILLDFNVDGVIYDMI
jgi:hypothetical protein